MAVSCWDRRALGNPGMGRHKSSRAIGSFRPPWATHPQDEPEYAFAFHESPEYSQSLNSLNSLYNGQFLAWTALDVHAAFHVQSVRAPVPDFEPCAYVQPGALLPVVNLDAAPDAHFVHAIQYLQPFGIAILLPAVPFAFLHTLGGAPQYFVIKGVFRPDEPCCSALTSLIVAAINQ